VQLDNQIEEDMRILSRISIDSIVSETAGINENSISRYLIDCENRAKQHPCLFRETSPILERSYACWN